MNLNQNISFTSYHQEDKLQKYLHKIKNKSFFNAGIRNNIKKSEKKPNAKNTVCSHLSNFKNQTTQATSRHRAMPADSWTTPLRNAEKVPEGMRLRSLFIVICHQLSSVLSRTLLSMEKVASQVMRKQFGPSVGSRKIPAPWYFPSLSVL